MKTEDTNLIKYETFDIDIKKNRNFDVTKFEVIKDVKNIPVIIKMISEKDDFLSNPNPNISDLVVGVVTKGVVNDEYILSSDVVLFRERMIAYNVILSAFRICPEYKISEEDKKLEVTALVLYKE